MSACVLHEDGPDAEVGYLCLDCFSWLRSHLLELPAVATWLEVNAAAGGSGLHDKVTGTAEDPIPLRLDVTDLIGPEAPNPTEALIRDMSSGHLNSKGERIIDQAGEPSLFDEMRSWAVLVEEESWEHGCDVADPDHEPRACPKRRGKDWDDRRTLIGAVSYLAGQLSWIVAQPWIDEFVSKVRHLGQQAHRVVPWRAQLIYANDPCATCGVRAVVIHLGEGFRRCEHRAGGCGKREKLSEYELRVLLPESRRAG